VRNTEHNVDNPTHHPFVSQQIQRHYNLYWVTLKLTEHNNKIVTADFRSHYNYFPFSLGPRNCIGQNFAQIEAKVLLSRFLQTFKFSLVPGQSRQVLERVTLRPKDGVMCTLIKRH